MSWEGQLSLRYIHTDGRTTALDRHEGPLRVLRALFPEGPAICHHVLVHPPGGVVGGDSLEMDIHVASDAHALITTPGATRFYRSAGPSAVQRLTARVEPQARLEWLPQETLVHDGARACNEMHFDLQPGAQMIGSDLLALGLPAAAHSFAHGCYDQRIELPGLWLERGRLDFDHPANRQWTERLLASPLGWAGYTVLGTLWFASGTALDAASIEVMLDSARAAIEGGGQVLAGASALDSKLVVVRVLAARTEAPMQLLRAIRGQWRQHIWKLPPTPPRVWNT